MIGLALAAPPKLGARGKAAKAEAEAQAAEAPKLQPDEPAAEAPPDGLWSWIDRMDGELPTPQGVAGLEERAQIERSEASAAVPSLTPAPAPKDFYRDPVKTLSGDPLYLDMVDPSEFDIPVEVNAAVEKWVRYFTGPGRVYYERWLTRSTRYRPLMYAELERQGMPRDLVYLSMIESGYNAHAYSHADAAGLWQFIPSTGKMYDLRIDWWVDDRRDPHLATVSAVRFLKELNTMFNGDWYLAWAAYNGGPGRIRRATREAGSTDFWVLMNGPYLHPETDDYVPKIIAAAIIGHHPERYGFTNVKYQSELRVDMVQVEGSVELERLAKAAGTDVDTLKNLNPALRRWATPPEGYNLRVPEGSGAAFATELAKIPIEKEPSFVNHKVAKGETLSGIASRYNVSVADVTSANNLANVNRIYVGMALVIPVRAPKGSGSASAPVVASANVAPKAEAPKAASAASSTPKPAAKTSTYTVRSGDTLSEIAEKHSVTVGDLRSWNNLSGATIFVGQQLKLQGGAAATGGSTVKHTVRKGDTLSGIASQYGVSTADLQKWNKIGNASSIQVGQALTVHLASSQWASYTVRSGDSLGSIATRHGCTVSELQSWNSLSGSVIHPGQQLRIQR